MRTHFFLLIACLFTACSTVEYINIETYNPAEVTFPKSVEKVLIVNNAVSQPDNIGFTYTLYGEKQDTLRCDVDSALFKACHSLGKSIVESSFFNDVLLYQEKTRRDNDYLKDEKLTPEKVRELCEQTGTDAIISLDRLLFELEKNVAGLGGGLVAGKVNVKMAGVIRGYLPDRENSLATIYVEDSVFWSEGAENPTILKLYIPSTDEALKVAGEYIGTKVTPYFIPHWQKETRWLFKSEGALWKEATAYVRAEKWEEAAQRWRAIYQKSSSWKERGKAASNLALYYEMNTQLKEAFDWANKSYKLFKENGGEEYNQTNVQQLYVETLGKRIQSNLKLNKQFGQE